MDSSRATPVPATAASTEMCSYAVDLWTSDVAILHDEPRLKSVLYAAAEAGQAIVLAEASHIFPNGAVTISLVLSQSHLNVHTWPELKLANIDLLTCGVLEGDTILTYLRTHLSATRCNVTRVTRDATGEPH
ncbi:adenosylmethionine decarboxylase [Nostocoides vanveenii]|uniref:S-adenosylmethionine decarboxylase n=1 Tax=Nostocoides vanveenii TaxID=330835 RepID=A0ABN2KP59_9MICO